LVAFMDSLTGPVVYLDPAEIQAYAP
jgi:hypothetical protein